MTSDSINKYSSILPLQVMIRGESGWEELDKGPGIFHIPFDREVGLRIRNSDDDDLKTLVSEWRKCEKLVNLNLSENRKISDDGIEGLQALSQLRELNLSSCDITNESIPSLVPLSLLENLNLSYCHRITDAGMKHIPDLRRLKYLDLQGCPRISRGGLARIRRPGLIIHR